MSSPLWRPGVTRRPPKVPFQTATMVTNDGSRNVEALYRSTMELRKRHLETTQSHGISPGKTGNRTTRDTADRSGSTVFPGVSHYTPEQRFVIVTPAPPIDSKDAM
ncbi:unnamed protein product [Alternaria burnsii]|nr:unnamed protein product [Alternaria burnsii]